MPDWITCLLKKVTWPYFIPEGQELEERVFGSTPPTKSVGQVCLSFNPSPFPRFGVQEGILPSGYCVEDCILIW